MSLFECECVEVSVYTNMYILVYMSVCVFVRVCACVPACVRAYMYVCVSNCVCIRTRTHLCECAHQYALANNIHIKCTRSQNNNMKSYSNQSKQIRMLTYCKMDVNQYDMPNEIQINLKLKRYIYVYNNNEKLLTKLFADLPP